MTVEMSTKIIFPNNISNNIMYLCPMPSTLVLILCSCEHEKGHLELLLDNHIYIETFDQVTSLKIYYFETNLEHNQGISKT